MSSEEVSPPVFGFQAEDTEVEREKDVPQMETVETEREEEREEEEAPTPEVQAESKTEAKSDTKGGVVGLARHYLPMLLDAFFTVFNVIMRLEPYALWAWGRMMVVYKRLEPYHPKALLQILTGVTLMFFGGQFMVTVALITALQQGGGKELVQGVRQLYNQAKSAAEAKAIDDKVDDDNNGVADVEELSASGRLARRTLLFLRVCDPLVVQTALRHLYTSMLAAMATLRVKFARTASLGASIGSYINIPVQRYIVPSLKAVTPDEYERWYAPIGSYICRVAGASIAFTIQAWLETISTAVFGGHMAIKGFGHFIRALNKPELLWLTEGVLDDALAWVLVAIGIYAQFFVLGNMPFILRLPLMPVYTVETVLRWFV
ncbi:hypothetical protein KIPB_003239 [Kipferlia bialata]|uniref:Uncharacterized protein n=1 Tax=Kipferlia bialata TaxID=797122 RepID=A0A9K3GGJ1_9EUKA|nr:hypothetical protein KIPB_003239 [Kipferlia bialata]|eukprot:g3239.t1